MFSESHPESPNLNQLLAIHVKLIDRGDSNFRQAHNDRGVNGPIKMVKPFLLLRVK